MYFPQDEFEARWRRTYAEMDRRGIACALIWAQTGWTYHHAMDVMYLTNFHSPHEPEADSNMWAGRSFSAMILKDGEEPDLHADAIDPRTELIATSRASGHDDVIKGVAEGLKARRIEGKVALVGGNVLPINMFRRLDALTPGIEFEIADDLMLAVRRIKSPRELDCVREGGALVSRGLNRLMEGLIGGKTEAEAAADAAHAIIKGGGVPFGFPCAHGETTKYFVTDPRRGYSLEAPKPGEVVRAFAYGPIWQGYWLDPARSAVCGAKPTPEQKALIEDCAHIVQSLMDETRAGVRVADIARRGDDMKAAISSAEDQGGSMWPFYGHGCGGMWEPPLIHVDLCGPEDVFETGMVASSETFLYREGVGGAAIEQNYIVHDDHVEVVTDSPMFWW